MRISLALAVIVSGVVTPPAIAALRPPIIREPWTPLRCPAHPVSTIDMEGCLEKAVTRSDREINASVVKIFFLLHRSADRGTFVRAERQWLQYRRQSCSAEASVYRGGSAQPVAFLACEKRRNIRHLADLRDMKQTLRHA